jgi:8-oxo-dGTP pyrophosphatase MutT (NUDIX family)
MSVVEKITSSDDSHLSAAQRALHEELGVPTDKVSADLRFIDTYTVGPVPSESYPGLRCVYEFNVYEWNMPLLYYREGGYVEIQDDKRIIFEWREAY